MKNVVIIILLLFVNCLQGQNCFISSDLTGENDIDVTEFESLACHLIDSLPLETQSDFIILDYAYYSHQINFDETLSEANQEFISTNKKNHYLFFGRKFLENREQILVKVSLPAIEHLSCLQEEELLLLEIELNYFVNKEYSKSKSASSALEVGISYLYNFILNQKECCVLNRDSNSCFLCPSPSLALDMALANNFNVIEIDETKNVNLNIEDNIDDHVYEFSSFEFKHNNSWYNLNNIIKDFVATYNSKNPVKIYAEIHFFNDLNCVNTISTINSEINDEKVRLRVIAIEQENGKTKIATKLFQRTNYGDGCGIIMNAVKLFLEDLGEDKNEIEKTVIIQTSSDEDCVDYYCKYAKFKTENIESIEKITDNWFCCVLDSRNAIENAQLSPEICLKYVFTDYDIINDAPIDREGTLSLQLKYYPSRCNSLGLVASGTVNHYWEAILETIDGKLRELIGKDNLLYDMHLENAIFYIDNRNKICE